MLQSELHQKAKRLIPQVKINKSFEHNIVNILLHVPISFNIVLAVRDGSFEYPQHMFWLRNIFFGTHS